MNKLIVAAIVGIISFSSSARADESELPQIPSSVAWMYVFIQRPDSTSRGSGKEIATMITPEEFRRNFTRFREMARKENAKLVVTAETENEQWIQGQIRYRGTKLRRAPYYNPGIDKVVPGAEVPTD